MANANQITTQRPAIFTRVRDMGLFVVIVCFGLAALFLEALYRLALTALFWTPPLFCGVWAMQATAALHLADPLAPLQAFLVGAFMGRFAVGRILDAIARWLG